MVEVLTYVYEPYEDGDYKSTKVYNGDKLVLEKQYAECSDGVGSYLQTETAYLDDGTTEVTTYDEDGNVI